jgi:aminoglycoside N3'-acetyltransferase
VSRHSSAIAVAVGVIVLAAGVLLYRSLNEFLRSYPDSRVNRHVARFVVCGKQAEYLISEQPWNCAFGLHSPLDRFLGLHGKIVLLGSDHDAVTFLHYVERVADRGRARSQRERHR